MPLINSILDVLVVEENVDYLIVEETDGTRYRINVGMNHPYIMHETLQIRVEGLERVVGEEADILQAAILESRIDVSRFLSQSLRWEDLFEWDPVRLYGEKIARHLFPFHVGRTYMMGQFLYPRLKRQNMREIHDGFDKLNDTSLSVSERMSVGSDLLRENPWFINIYMFLKDISKKYSGNEKLEKYGNMILAIANTAEMPDNALIVLQPHCNGYLINLDIIKTKVMLAFLSDSENERDQDKVFNRLHDVYMLNPFDPLGIRYYLAQKSDKTYPGIFNEDYVNEYGFEIDPYFIVKELTTTIRDEYDPDSRLDYKMWQVWSTFYKWMLIEDAHTFHPDSTREDILYHIAVHERAENMLVGEPMFRRELARMIAQGFSRHEAIHELGGRLMALRSKASNAKKSESPGKQSGKGL